MFSVLCNSCGSWQDKGCRVKNVKYDLLQNLSQTHGNTTTTFNTLIDKCRVKRWCKNNSWEISSSIHGLSNNTLEFNWCRVEWMSRVILPLVLRGLILCHSMSHVSFRRLRRSFSKTNRECVFLSLGHSNWIDSLEFRDEALLLGMKQGMGW